jgi:hypothetical protein
MNFFGSFTPGQLLASVTSGVQQTGNLIWPLFVFVGLLVAFYIAERVGDFIRNSVGGTKKSYRVGTEDEYPKRERDNFIEAVEIYNKAHPE